MSLKFFREVIVNPILHSILLCLIVGAICFGMSDGGDVRNITIVSAIISSIFLIYLFVIAVKGWIKNKEGITFKWLDDLIVG